MPCINTTVAPGWKSCSDRRGLKTGLGQSNNSPDMRQGMTQDSFVWLLLGFFPLVVAILAQSIPVE